MADREPVELMDLLERDLQNELYQVLSEDTLDRFKAIFESEEQPLHPEDTLYGLPLLFLAAGCGKRQNSFSPKSIQYLVEEKGADVGRLAEQTKAEKYSSAYYFEREYNRHANDYFQWEDHVYCSLLMNMALEGNIWACNYFYNHGADDQQITFNEWDAPIEGETALVLAERKLMELDSFIRLAVEDNIWLEGSPTYLTKERLKVARGLKWLRYITVDENIPKLQASWQNRSRLRHVLRGAPHTGRLEAEYMMKFLPKPAKFQKPSNINLRKINTTLFEGGRTRKRKQRKQRKTRSAK